MRPIPNFDRLARVYERLEQAAFGGALWRRRTRYLRDPRVASATRALVLGDGDGRFLSTLFSHHPGLQVTSIDASPAMIREQQERLTSGGQTSKVDFQCADLRSWAPERFDYDLVVTHFVFDCFTNDEVRALVQRIAPTLAEDARWLVSEFAVPGHGWRKWFWRLVIGTLYFAQRSLTGLDLDRVPDYGAALRAIGFEPASKDCEFGGALCSELWQRG